MKSKIIYQLIRDQTKINKILDLIQSDLNNFKHTRIDKYSIRFYYDLNDSTGITFQVYSPSNYALNELQKIEKEIE
jgi:nuclear transport factor 2 (NTF2) superfamily protein